jgi:mitogen-activated protein kinase 7
MAVQRTTVTALNQQFVIDAEYQFVKELGQGAYGCVLAAKHRRSGEGCAIKKITNIFTKVQVPGLSLPIQRLRAGTVL